MNESGFSNWAVIVKYLPLYAMLSFLIGNTELYLL